MDPDGLRAWFDDRVATHAFSGAAMAWRDGAPIFRYEGGLADRAHAVPIDPETRFAIASITKMPTAIAALRLVAKGRIRLDDPVIEVLPPEQRPAAMTSAVTLHHLLSHTSGLPNYHDGEAQTWDSWNANWDRMPTYHARRPADLLPLFRDLPAVSQPGEAYAYIDSGFILVGLVIEALTGRAYGDVVAELVLEPAGMTDTGIEALDDDPPRLATGYVIDDGPAERWKSNIYGVTANGMPDGGMITTPTDLARLVDALRLGQLLGPELADAMCRPQGPPSAESEAYGYGCELILRDGEVITWGHGGSDPGVSTMLLHHIATATTLVVLCNQDRGSWAATLRLAEALGIEGLPGPT